MKLKSYFNPNTKEAQVRLAADAAPAAPFVALGDVTHEANDNASGMLKMSVSHVIFQHIQEQVYRQYGLQDMQAIKITNGGNFRLLQAVHVDPGKTLVKPAEVITIQITPEPANATIDGYYCIAHHPELVSITDKTSGKFEVVFASDNATILEVGIKNTGYEELVPVEARTIVRQA